MKVRGIVRVAQDAHGLQLPLFCLLKVRLTADAVAAMPCGALVEVRFFLLLAEDGMGLLQLDKKKEKKKGFFQLERKRERTRE